MSLWQLTQSRADHAQQHLQQGAAKTSQGLQDAVVATARKLRRHAWPLSLALLLLAGAPLLAWWLRQDMRADSFDHTASREIDERVAALLQGEQLVPPAPLPPELFMTKEVELWRPDARFASREWDLLDAEFRQRLLLLFKLMQEQHGYQMVLVEGYRSPERQAALAAQGPQVTQAGPGASYHQYGLAADCAFMRQGRVVISEQDPWAAQGYARYGELAASLGLTWGGGWKTLKDLGHIELRRAGVLRRGGDNREQAARTTTSQ